ncbi:hypothetical protein ANN_08826 [Periplaneta americana]|uniref:Uncharacterized protein n=1 Tax=Periplaneta americana TaxID=6978 RepID=A0ABQ8T365_PERAM|nr:hypothetical protein ANN_08826 [Periplaneta americana]
MISRLVLEVIVVELEQRVSDVSSTRPQKGGRARRQARGEKRESCLMLAAVRGERGRPALWRGPWRRERGRKPTATDVWSQSDGETENRPETEDASELHSQFSLDSKPSKQASRSSTRVCVRICVSIRRPEFECSGPQLEGPEFEYSELSLKVCGSRYCGLELEVTVRSTSKDEADYVNLGTNSSIARETVPSELLDQYTNGGDDLLARIVPGDEIWLHHFEPEETKRQTMELHHVNSPTK